MTEHVQSEQYISNIILFLSMSTYSSWLCNASSAFFH